MWHGGAEFGQGMGSGYLWATSRFSEGSLCSPVEWGMQAHTQVMVRPKGEYCDLARCLAQFLPMPIGKLP